MEDWAEIGRLYLSERMPIKAIARRLGLSRNTVRSAVRSLTPQGAMGRLGLFRVDGGGSWMRPGARGAGSWSQSAFAGGLKP